MAFHNTLSALTVALAAGLIVAPGAGVAQTEAPEPPAAETQQPPAAQQPADIDPTQEQLQAFAVATVRMAQIQQEAQEEMQTAIQEAGLSIEEYNAIAQKAQTDEQVGEELRGLIGDELGG